MLVPPHSLHSLLSRLCSQTLAPPHSLQRLLCRMCSQMLAPRRSSLDSRVLFPPPQAPAPALVTAPSSTDSGPSHVISGALPLLPPPASARPSRTSRPTASVATTAPPTSGTVSPLAQFSVIKAISEVVPPSSSRATSVVAVGSEIPALASLHTSMVSPTQFSSQQAFPKKGAFSCNCPPKAGSMQATAVGQVPESTRSRTPLQRCLRNAKPESVGAQGTRPAGTRP